MNNYDVRISFVEHVEGQPRPFVHSIKVTAYRYHEACQDALAEFQLLAGATSVGWKREVKSVEIEQLD